MRIARLFNNFIESTALYKGLREEYDRKKSELENKEKVVSRLRRDVEDKDLRIQKYETQIQGWEDQHSSDTKSIRDKEKLIKEAETLNTAQKREISLLHSELDNEQRDRARHQKNAWRLARQFSVAQKTAQDLKKELSEEANKRDLLVELGTRDLEDLFRTKCRKEVDEAYKLCVLVNNLIKGNLGAELAAVREKLKVAERQVEMARGGYGYKDKEVRELRRQSLEALEVFENVIGLNQVVALYVNLERKVVYGTPGFLNEFPVTREVLYSGDIEDLFSHLDEKSREEIRVYAHNGFPDKRKFSPTIDKKDHQIEIIPYKLEDRSGEQIGTWLEFKDVGGGFSGAMKDWWNKCGFGGRKNGKAQEVKEKN